MYKYFASYNPCSTLFYKYAFEKLYFCLARRQKKQQ